MKYNISGNRALRRLARIREIVEGDTPAGAGDNNDNAGERRLREILTKRYGTPFVNIWLPKFPLDAYTPDPDNEGRIYVAEVKSIEYDEEGVDISAPHGAFISDHKLRYMQLAVGPRRIGNPTFDCALFCYLLSNDRAIMLTERAIQRLICEHKVYYGNMLREPGMYILTKYWKVL
jgi:hypothetical protein